MDFGIRCVISTSFGDIFYNNCFKNGVLPIRVSPEDLEKLFDDADRGANATLTVDLEKQEIRGPDGGVVHFEIDAHRKHCLLNGLDDIGLTKQKQTKIESYEERPERPDLGRDCRHVLTPAILAHILGTEPNRSFSGQPRDCLRDRNGASRHVGVQTLDHAAIYRHNAFAFVLGQVECRNQLARLLDFGLRG